MSYLVVANRNAGTAARDVVEEACRALGAEQVATGDAAEIDEAIDALDGRVLVVAGGDGSLHAVVDRLWQRGLLGQVELGLLPLGTGNDLARGLGLPLDPLEAAEVVLAGTVKPLDLLVDDAGGVVVNAVHAGLGAEAADRSEGMKDRLGKLAYPLGALIAAVRESGWDVRVSVDGADLPVEGPVLLVGVGNGPSIGGGTVLCPSARFDDGRLDVVVSTSVGAAARIAFGQALRKGEHLERDDVVTATGTEVRISGEPVRYDADGEVSDEVTDRTYRVVRAAWKLRTA